MGDKGKIGLFLKFISKYFPTVCSITVLSRWDRIFLYLQIKICGIEWLNDLLRSITSCF